MPPTDKYDSEDDAVDSSHGLLRNKLGLTDPAALERAEREALIAAYDQAALTYSEAHRFTADDVRALHRLFLGGIFDWAGTYRRIDLISGDIRWCHAAHIETAMAEFDRLLTRTTPFSPALPRAELLARLAQVHGELVVVHPFRDGNGRTTRLLCDLLLMQAEREPIGPGAFDDQEFRREYHAAVRAVWARVDYGPLTDLLARVVA
jgi:cell filamentation protein